MRTKSDFGDILKREHMWPQPLWWNCTLILPLSHWQFAYIDQKCWKVKSQMHNAQYCIQYQSPQRSANVSIFSQDMPTMALHISWVLLAHALWDTDLELLRPWIISMPLAGVCLSDFSDSLVIFVALGGLVFFTLFFTILNPCEFMQSNTVGMSFKRTKWVACQRCAVSCKAFPSWKSRIISNLHCIFRLVDGFESGPQDRLLESTFLQINLFLLEISRA